MHKLKRFNRLMRAHNAAPLMDGADRDLARRSRILWRSWSHHWKLWEQKVAGDRSLHRSFFPSSFELFQKGTQQVGWGRNTRKAFILIFTGIAIGQIKKGPTVIKFISKYDVPGNYPKGINWTSPIILDIKPEVSKLGCCKYSRSLAAPWRLNLSGFLSTLSRMNKKAPLG